jgi:hypothetical protein
MAIKVGPSEWIDAQFMHRKHPESFQVPTDGELLALRVGQSVKISNGLERFWVRIAAIEKRPSPFDTIFTGVVDNYLVKPRPSSTHYDYGSLVRFEGRHVYDVAEMPAK